MVGKRYLVTGGGTGGHIYPALTVGKALVERNPGSHLLYVGGSRGLEVDIVPREGVAFKAITVEGFKRKLSLSLISTSLKAVVGLMQALSIVGRFKPDVVIGTGGYVSGPVVLAAVILRRPTVIHEQNVVPGAANRMLSRYVSKVAISFDESSKYLARPERAVLTGNPIRPEVLKTTRAQGLRFLGFDDARTVLAFGGSQGSSKINESFIRAVASLTDLEGVRFMLATGRDKFEDSMALAKQLGLAVTTRFHSGIPSTSKGDIILAPYIDRMDAALACADMVVCRSGAITLAEITARGLPAVLIPHPNVPDDVQKKNAMELAGRGAAVMIEDGRLDAVTLSGEIRRLISDADRLRRMGYMSRKAGIPDALDRVLALIDSLA